MIKLLQDEIIHMYTILELDCWRPNGT